MMCLAPLAADTDQLLLEHFFSYQLQSDAESTSAADQYRPVVDFKAQQPVCRTPIATVLSVASRCQT